VKPNIVRSRATSDGIARSAVVMKGPLLLRTGPFVLAAWLGGLSTLMAMPAAAADAETDAKIKALEEQVEALSTQIQDLKIGTASKYAETQKQITAVAPSLINGRPTLTTSDGAFSASLRSLVQFDMGYYDQAAPPRAPQLSNGSNFRRARLGLDGKVYTDWEYSFIYDFGGSGTEGSSISAAYVQYDGFNPVLLRLGAFPPYANVEDSEGAADTLFLERATVTEIQRGLAGGDGRSAFSVVRAGERLFGSLALTGGRANQANILDEQEALLGRVAYLLLSSPDSKIVLGANGTSIFQPAGVNPPPGVALSLQNPTELRVDDTGTNGAPINLISTGNLNANSLTQWGVDGAANFKNFYTEGGYYSFEVDRKLSQPDVEFDGWYAVVSWVLTGEPHRYDPSRAAFRSPNVLHPVGSPGVQGITSAGTITPGWGAWEIALRYSTMDLDDLPFAAVAANRVRGGVQDIWTVGLNWYINNAIKTQLNYQYVDVNRLNAAGQTLNQDIDQISMRLQFAF
jgi:phosphate-selective porin OprO and OprP